MSLKYHQGRLHGSLRLGGDRATSTPTERQASKHDKSLSRLISRFLAIISQAVDDASTWKESSEYLTEGVGIYQGRCRRGRGGIRGRYGRGTGWVDSLWVRVLF